MTTISNRSVCDPCPSSSR